MADDKKSKSPAKEKAAPKVDAKSEAKTEAKTASKADAKIEAKPDVKAEPAPSYSRGEGQKAVTQAYKDNWNAIFGKKTGKKKRR